MREEIELATELAVSIIFGAAAKLVKKVNLTKNEVTTVGRAIGLLTLVTITPEGTSILSSFTKPEILNTEDPNVTSTTGGRKRRNMRGGAVSLIGLLIGALGLLFGGSTTMNLIVSRADLQEIVASARIQITSACPLDLQMGPPVGTLIDWRGDNARAIRTFRASEATCNAVKIAQQARIAGAQAELAAIVNVIPDRIATFSTAASIVSAGPAGFTPAGVTAAGAVGVVMRQVAQSAIDATLPKDLGKFARDLTTAFPFAEAEAAAAAPGAAAAAAEPRRSTGGARKTKKRMPKRRTTFRRPKFVY